MSYKIIADTFSVARDSKHYIQLKTLKKPHTEDQVWLTIEIEGGAKYARSTAQGIIDILEEVFFEKKSELNSYERLENALKEINLIISHLKEKRGEQSIGTISAIIAVFSGNELHLTQSKNAEAYLIRNEKLSLISEGLADKSDDVFVNIASGELMPDDKIILATSRLLRITTQSQLVNISKDGVTEALDAIRELVLNENDINLGVTCINTKLSHRISLKKLEGISEHPFVIKLKKLIHKAASSIPKNWIPKNLPLDKIPFIKIGMKRKKINKKTILIALVVASILLIISILFLAGGRRDDALREEYRIHIEALNQDLHVATTKGYSNDKETANAILDKTEREVRDILATRYFRHESLALLDKVQNIRDSVNNTKRLKDLKPYIDLSIKHENVEALGMVNLNDNIFAFGYNTLYEIVLDQVLNPKLIDENEVIIKSAAMEDKGIIAFLSQSGRIIEYNDGQFNFMNTEDENWQTAIDIAAYSKYIYLLSPAKNQIYKYARLRSKYSGASEYNTDVELNDAISLAIDGNIYILKKGGEIIKIYKSKKQTFTIEDMATDISEATSIYTAPEINNLYILDPNGKRVIIIEKGKTIARYYGQIIFEDLEDIRGVYVDKNEEKLYLLTKEKIYQVEL